MGYAVIQGYGLTETTSIISVNHPFRLGKGSIGKVLAGREVKLAPDGEILVRGSGVSAGYWTRHDLQPLASKEGWYGTGDIGERDTARTPARRTKEGCNRHLRRHECLPRGPQAALRRTRVKDCVVIALPQDGNAEPCAVLILRGVDADPEPVVKRANETLAEYQRMRNWFVWPELTVSPHLDLETAR